MNKKYTYKKYDGDDKYSYAVFLAADVKGKGTIIFYGQAKPVVSGCSRYEAKWRADELNNTKPKDDLHEKRMELNKLCNDFIDGK